MRPNRSIFVTVRDGLKLHVSHYAAAPDADGRRRPVLCLPGLTRNGRDFHDIAMALSRGDHARDVFTLDARGRGLSDHDRDWRNYSVPTEALDVIDVMTALELHDAAILGTSRGGLIAMVLAAMQPTLIGAVVLNDVGPVIERAGLARIAGYVGQMPVPLSWADAERTVADVGRRAFPAIPDSQWPKVARAWFNEKDGRPTRGYDPQLARTLKATDGPPPQLWAQFGALKHAGLLVIRGEMSDILSAATVAQMRVRHPNCATLDVKGEGHAPLLMDQPSIAAVSRFLADMDTGKSVAGKVF